jgi:pimeloyl-ACP methyl ester carboxylesterase
MHSNRHLILPISLLASGLLTGARASNNDNSTYQPRPYTVSVDPSFIEEIRVKVQNFHPTAEINAEPWFDGPPASNISTLAKYWEEEYDWFEDQDYINSNFSHYITTVPGPLDTYNDSLDIHFIHQRSARSDAIPILLLHGWPSTSLEWEKIIPGLIDPEDDTKPAFHVVAPDLPGYGFSPAPAAPGLGPDGHGAAMAKLMEQLGYERYALYSTDLGAVVAASMVVDYEPLIINHISDMLFVPPTDADLARYAANQTTAEETAYIASVNEYLTNHSAYASVHSTLPLSIAYALNDSPVGFLAWMYQLVYTVSDQEYSAHELVRQALLLYLPGVYGNIRSYKELFNLAYFVPKRDTSVPTSALQFGLPGGNTGYKYPAMKDFNYVVSFSLLPLPLLSPRVRVYAVVKSVTDSICFTASQLGRAPLERHLFLAPRQRRAFPSPERTRARARGCSRRVCGLKATITTTKSIHEPYYLPH